LAYLLARATFTPPNKSRLIDRGGNGEVESVQDLGSTNAVFFFPSGIVRMGVGKREREWRVLMEFDNAVGVHGQ